MDALGLNVKKAIESVIISENCGSSPSIDVSVESQTGDGFSSKSAAVTIAGNGRAIHLFVKYFPEDICNEQIEVFKSVFDTELLFYEVVFPEILRFQQDKGLRDGFDNVPKHYPTKTKPDGIPPIILDNLRALGYILRDIKEPASEDHISLILKTYAKLHATSFAMKDQKPEIYKKISSGIVDEYAEKFCDIGLTDTTIALIKGLINSLDPIRDKNIAGKCVQLMESLENFIRSLPKYTEKYSVICHGDCWSNNIMFLYDDKTGKLVDLKLLDWQVHRIQFPAIEALHSFYGLAKKEALSNFEHYRTLYYDTLANYIIKLGSDPEKLYPKQVFLDQWKKFAKFGLIISFSVNRVGFLMEGDVIDVVDNEEGKMPLFPSEFKEKDQYHNTMRDILDHFIQNEFL